MNNIELYIIFAGIDYLLGLITALVKGRTSKGNVSSKIMTGGIIKKICCVSLIAVSYLIEKELGVVGIYSMAAYSLCISEGLSILETCHNNGVACKPLEHFFESEGEENE